MSITVSIVQISKLRLKEEIGPESHGERVVQSLSCVRLFATPLTAARQASPTFPISRSLLTLTSSESVMPSSHLVLCRPLLPLPSAFPSIRVFSDESALVSGEWVVDQNSASGLLLLPLEESESALGRGEGAS